MPPIQVLMPMGGLGSRFKAQGYTTPKALIQVDGMPMFKRALESFSSLKNARHLFVIRQDQQEEYGLDSQILGQFPGAKITVMKKDTRGAVETAMLAADTIDDKVPIIIADCDIYFESKDYFDKLQRAASDDVDGILLTFASDNPRYSYAEIGEAGKVIRTAEKLVISKHAILGGYFFKSGSLFKSLATKFLSEELPEGLSEYYMSHLFNLLLERRGNVETAEVDTMNIFGTPEELKTYFMEHPRE